MEQGAKRMNNPEFVAKKKKRFICATEPNTIRSRYSIVHMTLFTP